MRIIALLILGLFGPLAMAQRLPGPLPSQAGTNGQAKAARTVHLVYDAAQADIYYSEMIVDEISDHSFIVPCGWENGYFGLQQFDGENKRALNFAVWTPSDTADADTPLSDEPVEVVYASPKCVIKQLGGKAGGFQCMRQMNWRLGETNRFAIQAQVQSNKTAYTAWLFNEATVKWERLATFRAVSKGRWLRGYYSFIEDFRRDFVSAKERRNARFQNIWIHQDKGAYVPVVEAMFTVSSRSTENRDAVDAGTVPAAFTLATGGATVKTRKIGRKIGMLLPPPMKPEAPDLPFLYDKPVL